MSNNKAGAGPERHVWDLLSTYIDDNLDKATHDEVRAHLEECADCRADYIELRATRHMLRSLPVAPPPRAFTLTEEAVARRPGLLERLLAPRNAPRLATGSALAFTLLVVVLAGNLFVASGAGSLAMRAPAPVDLGVGVEANSSQAEGTPAAPQDPYAWLSADQAPVAAPTAQAVINPPMETDQMAKALPTVAAAGQVAPQQTPATGGGAPAGGPPPAPITTPATSGTAPGAQGAVAAHATTTPGPPSTILGLSAAPTTTTAGTSYYQIQTPDTGLQGFGDPSVPTTALAINAGSTTSPSTTGSALRLFEPGATANRDQAQYSTSPDVSFSIGLAIEVALALLGVLLAAGAIIAGRRGVRSPPGE